MKLLGQIVRAQPVVAAVEEEEDEAPELHTYRVTRRVYVVEYQRTIVEAESAAAAEELACDDDGAYDWDTFDSDVTETTDYDAREMR